MRVVLRCKREREGGGVRRRGFWGDIATMRSLNSHTTCDTKNVAITRNYAKVVHVHEVKVKGIDIIVLCYECYSRNGKMSSKEG